MYCRVLVMLFMLLSARLPGQDTAALRGLESARQLESRGSLPAAAKAYEALLPAFRAGPDRGLLARVLLEAGQAALALGDYQRAIDRASESARLFRERKDGRNEALATNTAGSAQLYRGEYTDALRSFQRSLQLDIEHGDAKGEITHRSNIGNVYFFQGKYLDALRSYEHALRRVEETARESWNPGRRQLILSNLATLYEQLGQNEKALDYYRLARAGGSALPPREYAQLLSNLGTVYRRLGDAAKALETYRSAQRLYQTQQHSDGQIHVLHNIGIALALDYHDLPGALGAFTEALRLAEATSNRRQVVLGHIFRGEALFRLERLDESRGEFAGGLDGARQIGAAEEQWTAQYGLGRIERKEGNTAAALRDFRQAIANIESVRSGLGGSSLKAEFLADKRAVYDALIDVLLGAGGAGTEQLFGLFEQARSRNLRDALRSTMPPPTVATVRTRLGPRSLLIEYWMGSGRVAALWMTRENSGVVTKPVTAADLESVRALTRFPAASPDSAWRSAAERIGELLLSGIPAGGAIHHLLLVPDGDLHGLPFELLATGPSEPLLVERFAVSYLPSAALLCKDTGRRRIAPPWSRQLVAFGDPAAPARGALPADERWSRLPDAAREIREVAAASGGRAEIHAGADDLKSYLVNGRAAGAPLLHFTTHATVDTTDPNRSRILFTPENANEGSEYLFWREVQGLPLRGVQLVTLSACDTEGGKMVRGEGIQSFSRAFLAAGAGATVTTLWRVADRPTADFMQLFYEHLAAGETKAEALRAAKLSFLRSGSERSQPRCWAAFVLNGDGQAPVRPVLSWGWLIGPLGGVLLALVAIARFRLARRATC